MNLKEKIDEFPDFPKKGILFRDFSPILRDPSAISYVVEDISIQRILKFLQALNHVDFCLPVPWPCIIKKG